MNTEPIRVVSGVIIGSATIYYPNNIGKNEGLKILVDKRRSDQTMPGKLYLPGGKVEEYDDGDEEALARELYEELGIDVEINTYDEIANFKIRYPHGFFDVHFYRIKSIEGLVNSKEGNELFWMSEKDIIDSPVDSWLEVIDL